MILSLWTICGPLALEFVLSIHFDFFVHEAQGADKTFPVKADVHFGKNAKQTQKDKSNKVNSYHISNCVL